jgi:hypothetical protein
VMVGGEGWCSLWPIGSLDRTHSIFRLQRRQSTPTRRLNLDFSEPRWRGVGGRACRPSWGLSCLPLRIMACRLKVYPACVQATSFLAMVKAKWDFFFVVAESCGLRVVILP